MTFNNSILAGTTLVRDEIQSEGFVSGSTGWRISRNGNAEFNNITSRGSFIAGDASLASGSLTISNGNDVSTFEQHLIQWTDDAFATRTLQVWADPTRGIYLRKVGLSRLVLFDVNTGFMHSATSVSTRETWNTFTLPAGWTAAIACQYKLYPDGIVRMRGITDANVSPIPDGTVIGALSAGYRPTQAEMFVVAFDNSTTKGRAVVRTNGNVEIYDAPNDFVSLSGIAFSVI